jgi:hypothetical protein
MAAIVTGITARRYRALGASFNNSETFRNFATTQVSGFRVRGSGNTWRFALLYLTR